MASPGLANEWPYAGARVSMKRALRELRGIGGRDTERLLPSPIEVL